MCVVLVCMIASVRSLLTCNIMSDSGISVSTSSVLSGLCWSSISGETKGLAVVSGSTNENGDIYFERCGFYDITGTGFSAEGGAVSLTLQGKVAFVSCEFKRVSAEGGGGGFYLRNTESLVVSECLFEDVSASGYYGGAFYVTLNRESGFLQVGDSQFLECISGSKGSICYCTLAGYPKPTLANCTFDNCNISCSKLEQTLSYAVYLDTAGNEFPVTFRKCLFNLDATFDSELLLFDTTGPVVFEYDSFNGTKTGASLVKYTWDAWKSLEVVECDFLHVTAECDGIAIDTEGVSSVIISNCTFEDCISQTQGIGGVVVVRADTTACQISNCHFTGNSCSSEAHSLRIFTSSVNVTGCSFSSHTGALPVIKVEGGSALLSIGDFTISHCLFENNSLDGAQTGVITFPEDKVVRFSACQFLNNQASVTLSKCTKLAFEYCYFFVSLGETYYPVIRDNGTPVLEVTHCSFAHSGDEPNGGVSYVQIDNSECQATVSQSCFGSSQGSAIQGGNQDVSDDTVFGEDCKPPELDPIPDSPVEPEPEPDPDSASQPIIVPGEDSTTVPLPLDSGDEFPTGAVVGGIFGAIAFIAIVCVVVYVLVRRRRQGSASESLNPEEQ